MPASFMAAATDAGAASLIRHRAVILPKTSVFVATPVDSLFDDRGELLVARIFSCWSTGLEPLLIDRVGT